MGCDIHAYLEVKDPAGRWELFAHPSVNRDYELFGLLGGVRHGSALVAPRGIPRDISPGTVNGYTLEVVEEPNEDARECRRGQAEKWISGRLSEWWDREHWRVTDPDAHTPSWLTTEELQAVSAALPVDPPDDPRGWQRFYQACLLGAMNGLGAMGYETRLVFWFDN